MIKSKFLSYVISVPEKLYKNGNISFPFRNKADSAKVEKANIISQPVKKSASMHDSLQEEESGKKSEEKEISTAKAVQIDLSALRDSTDYADKYLFNNEDSPLNVKE